MSLVARAPLRPLAPGLRRALRLLGLALLLVTPLFLGYQLWRLMFASTRSGAMDLLHRSWECISWFETGTHGPIYPPATLLVFHPLVGWLPFALARILWAGLQLACLLGLVRHALALTRVRALTARLAVALLVLGHYATGAGLGNGQLTIVALWALCEAWSRSSPARLSGERPSWRGDLALALLLVIALLKPSFSGPLVVALPLLGAWRAGFLGAGLYGLLTAVGVALRAPVVPFGVRSIGNHATMKAAEYSGAPFPRLLVLALVLLLLTWLWVFLHRRAERWRLFALVAVVTHGLIGRYWFDDLLLLVPLLVLLRDLRALRWTRPSSLALALLTGALCALSIAPGGEYLVPPRWGFVFLLSQRLVWLLTLGYLFLRTRGPSARKSAAGLRRAVGGL